MSRVRRWLPLLAALAAILVFLPALKNGFVDWDDESNFLLNASYRGLGVAQLKWMWTTVLAGHYIPLTWMTFGADYALWGMNARGYHLTSVLFHAANAALVFLLIRRLLEASGDGGADLAAFVGAMLFALHPLRVESVVWITERRDVLSLFFLLAATLAYCRAPRPNHRAALIFFVLSLLSKATAMTFPVILFILDIHPLRRWREPGVWREKLPYWIVALAAAAVAGWAMARGGTMLSTADYGAGARVAQALYGLGFYIRKTVWPAGLSPIYEAPPGGLPASMALAGGAVWLGVGAWAAAVRREKPAALAAWCAYGVLLFPVLGLFQSGPQLVADRYSYAACVPWAILAAGALAARPRLRLPVALLIAAYAAGAWRQATVWRDSESLWTRAAAVAPQSPMARNNLGLLLKSRGRLDEAVAQLREAVRLKPGFAFAHSNLGAALAAQGHGDEAFREFREALRIAPGFARGHYNLACALGEAGRDAEAAEEFEAALRLDPNLVEAANNLGNIYMKHGRWEAAARNFEAALRARPGFAEPECNLGIALSNLGRKDEALSHYRRAIETDPGLWPAHYNLALDLESLGRKDEARGAYRQAAETAPPDAAIRRRLEEKLRSTEQQ